MFDAIANQLPTLIFGGFDYPKLCRLWQQPGQKAYVDALLDSYFGTSFHAYQDTGHVIQTDITTVLRAGDVWVLRKLNDIRTQTR